MRTRRPAKNSINYAPRLIHARFAGKCSCGKSIVPGEVVFYDKWRPCKCLSCGQRHVKLSAQKLSEIQAVPEAQRIIDRINQIKALLAPLCEELQSELFQLAKRLKTSYSTDRGVMRYFQKFVKCIEPNSELIMITAKFHGYCVHCARLQKTGAMVLYDLVEKNLHCIECDCIIMQELQSASYNEAASCPSVPFPELEAQ